MGSLPFGDFRVFHGFSGDMSFGGGGGVVVPSSLVLDSERGELVRASGRMGKKGEVVPEVRAAMALKSHCEAERRRRERINSHLTTLRGLVPTTSKLDKAALLAEVINQVKELKSNAAEISRGCTLPSDMDEVRVEEAFVEGMNEKNFLIKASICCEDRLELLPDLKQTLQSLGLKIVSAEISTLGGRLKSVFVMACEKNNNSNSNNNKSCADKHVLTSSVQMALESVLDRVSSQIEFSPRTLLSGKRRRTSPFDSSVF